MYRIKITIYFYLCQQLSCHCNFVMKLTASNLLNTWKVKELLI
jgi:hypothetical protein